MYDADATHPMAVCVSLCNVRKCVCVLRVCVYSVCLYKPVCVCHMCVCVSARTRCLLYGVCKPARV